MGRLIDIYDVEKTCECKGNFYTVRDNGAVMRHPQDGKKPDRWIMYGHLGQLIFKKDIP